MASKNNPLKGAHTAGIFADMTIDGPVIGTLVLVVDRAKNLPNRKTIGKQDPYCAARLGKEAKKTNTDIRGGQTPRWDQELRFKVHDSPDYFQLKVSVFSDDKKTELIGETWIDLRDIIVPGGGQSDQWHSLNCRSKYAGEIRLETTYYDSRPPEKPPVAVATTNTASSASMSGSARGRQGVDPATGGSVAFGPRGPAPKRRPLPSDPVTGQPPPAPPQPQHQPQSQPRPPSPLPPQAAPLQGPEVSRTPPRPQPNPPSAYNTHTPTRPPMPPSGYSNTPPHAVVYQQQQPLQRVPTSQVPNGQFPTAQGPDPYAANGPDAGFDNMPSTAQYHHNRHQSHHSHQSHSRDRSQYGSSELPPDFTDGANFQDRQLLSYDQQPRDVQEAYYNTGAAAGPTPTSMAPFYDGAGHAAVDDRPPPPPVHRNRNNSNSANAPDAVFRNSHDASPQKGSPLPTMRHDVLRNEAHRHSTSSAYPGRPTYRPLEGNSPAYSETYPDPSLHSSSQPIYDGSGPALDEIPSTAPLNVAGNRGTFSASPVSMHNSSTPSQNHYGEVNGPTDRTSPSPMASRDYRRASTSPQPGMGPAPHYAAYDSADPSYRYGPNQTDDAMHAYDSGASAPMSVPASLVPGIDPSLAMEVRSRTHQEERYSGHQQQVDRPEMRYSMPSQSMAGMPAQATPPRGRQLPGGEVWAGYQDGSPQTYTPQRSQTHAVQAYNTPPQAQVQKQISDQRYDRSPGPYSSGVPSPAGNSQGRGASPNPQHTIKRKSISPAPSPRKDDFDAPFGPDSFNSLNPTLAKTLEEQVRPDYNEASGKIVMHDGREVDPSDHLPVETWAPEPEPKPPKAESPAAAASPRDYSTPTSGRKQLRIAGRPQSSTASSGITFSSADDKNTFTPTSRNRLQKKTNRQSTTAIPVSGSAVSTTGSPMGSAPLAPLTHSRQQQANFTPPRALARASTYDYPNENYSPAYYGGTSPGRTSMGGGAGVPPLPAKISMNGGSGGADSYRSSGSYRNSISGGGYQSGGDRSPVMSGALPMPASDSPARVLPWDNGPGVDGGNGTGGELSLVEELSKIDIGTGRARRHQGQYY